MVKFVCGYKVANDAASSRRVHTEWLWRGRSACQTLNFLIAVLLRRRGKGLQDGNKIHHTLPLSK